MTESPAPSATQAPDPVQLAIITGLSGAGRSTAAKCMEDLGIEDVAIVGLAKRLEEVWVPGDPDPIILPRTSEGLYLLQRVRDEAHRFAITYHRQKRSKRMTASELDAIPGLGQTRKAALLKHFGSVRKLKAATVAEIGEVSGIGASTAEAVHAALTGENAPVTAHHTGSAG